ncbi:MULTISPECIES: type II secretion system protein GspM [unclassified Sphingomonas]|uniref:type II secretion system protein GspM n=1 Tax=Novosphingobium rhizosphaerae TaxID=1551649 RepID=UPI0015CCB658
MTRRPLSPREAKLVAGAILLAAMGLAWLGVVQPIIAGFADRAAQREQLLARQAANDRMIAAVPRLRRAAQEHQRALGAYALKAGDAPAATGQLRAALQAALIAAGGTFRGAEDLPPPPGRVACRLSARLSPDQLGRFLALAQNHRPALVITALAINAEDALVTGRATALDVQLEASAPVFLAASR